MRSPPSLQMKHQSSASLSSFDTIFFSSFLCLFHVFILLLLLLLSQLRNKTTHKIKNQKNPSYCFKHIYVYIYTHIIKTYQKTQSQYLFCFQSCVWNRRIKACKNQKKKVSLPKPIAPCNQCSSRQERIMLTLMIKTQNQTGKYFLFLFLFFFFVF